MQDSCLKPVVFRGRGITSGRTIEVQIERKPAGHGIVFQLFGAETGEELAIPATAQFVVNTMRNVVIGQGPVRLCIVEHFLAAAGLFGLDDLLVTVDGPEMPLGDGSAAFWIDLFKESLWEARPQTSFANLPETLVIKRGDRVLMAIPDDSFSMSYLMDWNHPLIGRRWQTWSAEMDWQEISRARTFGLLKEHEMLGIANQVVSLTADGFSQPLHWPDEPVRHKLLDLFGDLMLAGVNPRAWKARFISIKAGHELDVEMARKLSRLVGA